MVILFLSFKLFSENLTFFILKDHKFRASLKLFMFYSDLHGTYNGYYPKVQLVEVFLGDIIDKRSPTLGCIIERAF